MKDYNNKIVAFIDILGFETLVKSLSTTQINEHRFNDLLRALKKIKNIENIKQSSDEILSEIDVSVFSDCIALSAPESNLFSIIWTAGWLQAQLLFLGILTRGGIASGLTYHEDGILFGEGMLAAYRLESKSAVYPRIIISEELAKKDKKLVAAFAQVDADGLTFINPFTFAAIADQAMELAADGYDPRAIYFEKIRDYLTDEIRKTSREDYLAKYKWMAKRFNAAISIFNENSLVKIEPVSLD